MFVFYLHTRHTRTRYSESLQTMFNLKKNGQKCGNQQMVAGEKSKLAHACKAAPAGGEKCEKSDQNSGQKKQSWQDVLRQTGRLHSNSAVDKCNRM